MISYTLDQTAQIHDVLQSNTLKLDVQGSEIDVLKGGLTTVTNAYLITLEISVVEFHQKTIIFSMIYFMILIILVPMNTVNVRSSSYGCIKSILHF
jgi:hypothetical protein